MMLMSFRYEPYLLPESFSPSEFDAICGWARQNFGHPGNKRLRDIINQNIPAYKKAKTKSDKGKVIVDLCKQLIMDSPTRTGFVKLDTKSGRWYFVGFEKSKEKIGHALRKAAQFQAKKNRRAVNEEGGAAGRSSHSDDVPESPSDHSSLDGFLHSPLVMAGSAGRRRQEEDTPTSDEDRHQHSPRHHSIQRDTRQPLLSPVAESSSMNHDSVHSPLPPPPRSLLPMQRLSSNNKEGEETSHVVRFQIGEPFNMFLSNAALAAAEVAARESGMRDHHQHEHEEPSKNTATTTYQHANGASPMESPVRRSMFDSPMKSSPIDHHHHHDHEPRSSIMVPLPLSSNHNMEDDDDDIISPARLPPRQGDGRAMASSPMSHVPPPPPYPPPPPPPSYYYPYPPPPSGYMYYPVPVPIPAYPYHHLHHHHHPHYPPAVDPPPLEPRPMAPSALRREPKYAPQPKKPRGDEQKDEL